MPAKIAARELGGNQPVTQYGAVVDVQKLDPPFRRCPRVGIETDVSLTLGQLSVDEAARIVRRTLGAAPSDGVRYSTVGKLRAAGFVVTHTPSRWNPGHLSVELPSQQWEKDAEEKFDGCFSEPVWVKNEEEGGGK